MYQVTVSVSETVGGLLLRAQLDDRCGTEGTVVVATHGPLLRTGVGAGEGDLQRLIETLEWYVAFLNLRSHLSADVENAENSWKR